MGDGTVWNRNNNSSHVMERLGMGDAMDLVPFEVNRAGFLARTILERLKRQNLPRGARLPGMRDLAKEYGTSVTTVQGAVRMLHEHGILECRASAGVFVKFATPTPVKQVGRRQIGLITMKWRCDLGKTPVRDQADTWSGRIFKAAADRFHLAEYQTTELPLFHEDLSRPDTGLRLLDDMVGQLAAVVFVQWPGLAAQLERRGLVWASINAEHSTDSFNFVSADNVGGFARLGRSLARDGRGRVAMLIDQVNRTMSFKERMVGVHLGMIEAGMTRPQVEVIETELYGIYEQHAFEHVTRRLKSGPPPQAIVANGDYLAIGAIRAAQAHGLRVPEDVAVIGGTGLDLAQYTVPALTVVSQPTLRMGWELGNMVLQMLRENRRRIACRRVPPPLIFRESYNPGDDLRREVQRSYEGDLARFEMQFNDQPVTAAEPAATSSMQTPTS